MCFELRRSPLHVVYLDGKQPEVLWQSQPVGLDALTLGQKLFDLAHHVLEILA